MAEHAATGWWTSLRGRLILLALIAFVPLVGFSLYRAIEARQQVLSGARATVERMARDAEGELTAHIQSTRQLVHAMAANPVLRGSDFAACAAVLAAQLKLGERYVAFVVAGRDGTLLCSSDPAAASVNYSDRDHFRRVLETRAQVVASPVIGRVAKRPIISVDQPLLDANGEVLRVLLAGLDLAWVGAEISSALRSEDLITVFSDEEGRVLYRRPHNEKWFGHLDPKAPINRALRSKRPGETFDSVDFEGVARIFAFARSREHAEGSLVIRVGAGRDALTAAANRDFAVALVVLVIIAGLVLLAVIFVAEKFVRRPVAALARAAGRLGEGDLSERVSEAKFSGELAGLAGGFNRMAAALQTQMARLAEEQRRTQAQLEHLNLLDHITRATGERQDLKSIFQVVVRSLEGSLPVDFGCVCLHDAVANALMVTSVGAKSEALAHELAMDENAAIDVDANGLGRCVQGELVYEPDIGSSKYPFPARLARGGLRSLVMAPLKSESRVFGVLVVARREAGAFGSVECEFLRQLSEHVALAAHQAQLYGSLQEAYDELRETQAAAMQEERLRALGQMASGIAHDINNTLSPVSLYAESLLETEKGLSERARGYLETIQRAVDDVAETVARMREFYRQREEQLELAPVDVNQMVQQVLDLTRVRWSDMPQQRGITIRVQVELAPDLPKIMGAESEIREALVNLVFNAVDAMTGSGTLTLRTRLHGGSDREGVAIEVADEGAGMDEETRRRCLEPFFTTKGVRGTGLGLAMVFGIMQRHSAEIEIDSAPGAGTTMRLVFDVPTAILAEPGQPAAVLKAPSRLRLLLIDDDPILLKSLRDALETDGHVIVAANGGEQGIAEFRAALERGETYAAVITDLGMPYVDGRKVAAAVKEASPATPVILLTGWGKRLIADGDIPPHVDRVLAKPPKLRQVREALAKLCGTRPPEKSA